MMTNRYLRTKAKERGGGVHNGYSEEKKEEVGGMVRTKAYLWAKRKSKGGWEILANGASRKKRDTGKGGPRTCRE